MSQIIQAFLNIVNMSISANFIVLVVLLLRFILKKVPKWITVALWGIVAIRLVCPFFIESELSLITETEWIEPPGALVSPITPDSAVGIGLYYIMEQKSGETLIVYGHYENGKKVGTIRFIYSVNS
jgi:hypothetical protein